MQMPKVQSTLASQPYQVFQPLVDEDFQKLKASIKKHGQQHPIIVDENDFVIDGHHRQRACLELDIEPLVERRLGLAESDKFELAISLNLTSKQTPFPVRCFAAARMAQNQRGPKGPSLAELAKLWEVGTRSIKRAKRLLDIAHPSLTARVERGEFSISLAEIVAAQVLRDEQTQWSKMTTTEFVKEAKNLTQPQEPEKSSPPLARGKAGISAIIAAKPLVEVVPEQDVDDDALWHAGPSPVEQSLPSPNDIYRRDKFRRNVDSLLYAAREITAGDPIAGLENLDVATQKRTLNDLDDAVSLVNGLCDAVKAWLEKR